CFSTVSVQDGFGGNLRVGQGDPQVFGTVTAIRVFKIRVNSQADAGRRISPLTFEVLGGGYHGDTRYNSRFMEHFGYPQRKGRFAGTRCSNGVDSVVWVGSVEVNCFLLPCTKLLCSPPGSPFGYGWWDFFTDLKHRITHR